MPPEVTLSRLAPGLAVITLPATRPSAEMASALAAICGEINMDMDTRAAVITGSGPAFCRDYSAAGRRAPGFSLATPVALLDCPVIAAINGSAVGMGLELALACDVRIASRSARFSLPGIRFGRLPQDGATQRLPRLIGRSAAMEMMLTGEVVKGADALRLGLVNRLLPGAQVLEAALETGRQMAGMAEWSLKYCKEAVYKGLDMTLSQGLQLEADLYFLLHTTEDRREGIQAFKEKRRPQFRGR